jgi:hypothetical protein
LILNYFTKENPGLIWAVQTKIYGDLIKTKSYFCSNPNHPSKIQRLRIVSSSLAWFGRTECREAPWPRLGRAHAQATVHETQQGLILHDVEDKEGSFCRLTVVETDDGKLAMGRRLGRPSTAVGMTSDGAPAPRTSPVAVV